jgi:GNAT superfamily N-acetyltransferase
MAALAATWPPQAIHRIGPWTIRDGAKGGKRVSAATAAGAVGRDELTAAEAAMAALGQPLLVQVRGGEQDLDQLLEGAGYAIEDPTLILVARAAPLAVPPPRLSAFAVWPPLGIQDRLWAQGGIDAARRAVMDRVTGPKTAILGRTDDQPAGTAFVAVSGDIAMLHAAHVPEEFRRRGTARHMLAAAAVWAAGVGASWLALAVTAGNAPARALYASAGFVPATRYHYRHKARP